ncbi:MAG: lysine--tRNA ligase [Candidatus Bostrichicola ureolyticus]|nr:MAG: lysine--tRNA ligase [Candidatus Bostrichicola ureolyticus]
MQLSDQEIIRRNKLKKLLLLGIDPYPSATYPINITIKEILENYEEGKKISIAGRLMSMRIMGKTSFADIQDDSGRMQIYVIRDEISQDTYNIIFKKLLDIGDIIGVKGFIFKTKLGEITIWVKELCLLSKSLRPIPQVKIDSNGKMHYNFSNPEQRYRMRYVDLIVNKHIKDIFIKRNQIIQFIRQYFNKKGYIEVETPILHPIPGGAIAKPFVTYHNALNIPLYLRIANELYLKRLIVGGFKGVYEFAKDFRNEGMDRIHNPEFTILELYVAYKDYYWMMDFIDSMIENMLLSIIKSTKIKINNNNTINFKAPFIRIPILKAIKQHTNLDISKMDKETLLKNCKKLGINTTHDMDKGKIIDEIFSEKCEKHYIQPTFIIDYPIEMSPLTKKHRNNKYLTERFELIINGQEIANAYSELNDPIDQLERFKEQIKIYNKNESNIDYDFIRSLEFGMPPTAGIGIGIDRLVMLLTKQNSIQEVLLFPQMKPEKF